MQYDFRHSIQIILKEIDEELLQQELQIPGNQLLNYLNQLITNIKLEVAHGVFVMPFTGSIQLQNFTLRFNQKVIEQWLKGARKKYSTNNTNELILQILQNYEQLASLAVNLQLEQILEYRDHLFQIMTSKISQMYNDKKVQVAKNIYMIGIDSSLELGTFLSILNKELALNILDLVPLSKEIKKKCGPPNSSEEKVELEPYVQISNPQESLQTFDMLEFFSLIKLTRHPDNRKLEFQSTHRRKMIQQVKDEQGIFKNNNHFQSFKVLVDLSFAKFEKNQFIEYLQAKQAELSEFNVDMFAKLCDPHEETEYQNELYNSLVKQLENTKVNTREFKEAIYKFVFLRVYAILDQFKKNWGQDYYKTNRNRMREKKAYKRRKTARKYIQYGNNEHYIWQDCIKNMLLNFKGYRIPNKMKKIENILILRQNFFRVIGLTILLESEYVIAQQQMLMNP